MASNFEEDGSKCPICFETYKIPKALDCLHTYCESCIHEYIMKSKEKGLVCDGIECPLCRFVTKLDKNKPVETWSKSLRSNFALASLLEGTSYSDIWVELDDKPCQPCLKQEVNITSTVFCTVCNERLCGACKKVHDRLEFIKGHKSIDIGSNDSVEFFKTFQKYQKCEQHGKKLKFFCKDEDKLCCSTCAIIAHRACKGLVELSEIATGLNITVQGSVLAKQISELEKRMKNSEAHFVAESKKLTVSGSELIDRIRQLNDQVNQRFEEILDKIKGQIKSVEAAKKFNIMQNAVDCNVIFSELQQLKHILDLAHQNGNTEQLFVIFRKLKDDFAQIKFQVAQKYTDLESLNLTLNVSALMEDFLNKPKDFISLSIESTTKKLPTCSPKSLHVIAEVSVLKEEYQEKEPWYRGIGFLRDGRVVAVDQNNKKCIVLSENLQKVGEVSLNITPLNLAVTDEDLIIITSGGEKKLCLFQMDENNKLIENRVIPITLKCDSISLIDSSKCIVGTFDSFNPVHIVDLLGNFTELDFDFRGKKFDIGNFKCCFTEETDHFLITDKKGNAVYVCDITTGTMLTVQDDRLAKPKGISHYMNDMYFVCCAGSDSLLQITSSGDILATTGIDISSPYSICVSQDKSKLIVSNSVIGEKKLLLFNIQ